jgi:hypothetical protein
MLCWTSLGMSCCLWYFNMYLMYPTEVFTACSLRMLHNQNGHNAAAYSSWGLWPVGHGRGKTQLTICLRGRGSAPFVS